MDRCLLCFFKNFLLYISYAQIDIFSLKYIFIDGKVHFGPIVPYIYNRQPKLRNTWIFKYIQYFYITALKSIGRETGAAVSSRTANTRHNLTVTTQEPNATTTTRVSQLCLHLWIHCLHFFLVYNSLSTFFFSEELYSLHDYTQILDENLENFEEF